jgi:putative DNA primase/helicase
VGKPDDKHEKQVVMRKGICVSVKSMEWLWQERIPSGAITWIVGQPGNAKSLLTVEIAACASTGRKWPDGPENTLGAVKVLMCCMEDDLEKTVVPRLIAAGADLRNIDFIDDKSFREKIGDILSQKRAIDLDQDMETLLEVIKANKEYKLMICDPITGIFGAKSINKDQEVHPILQSLATCAKRLG